jgi:hypothetical protein
MMMMLLAWFRPTPALATIGLAEWEVRTPGTNIICHSDPFIATHDTCLRPPDDAPGVTASETIYVSHIEWWQYFKGYVVGKAKKGFFVFDETTRKVTHHETEALWQTRLKELSLDTPLTRRILPADGWKISWAPILRQQIEERRKSAAYQAMSDVEKAAMEKQFEQYREPDLRPVPPPAEPGK